MYNVLRNCNQGERNEKSKNNYAIGWPFDIECISSGLPTTNTSSTATTTDADSTVATTARTAKDATTNVEYARGAKERKA
jgi:hypothetical protein